MGAGEALDRATKLSRQSPTLAAPAAGFDRFSPAARLLALAILATAIGFAQGAPALALALFIALGALLVSRLTAALVWHRLAHVEGFLIVLLILVPLTLPGTPIATLGPVSVSAEGLARAVVIAVKVNAAVILVNALVGTLEPARLPSALAALRLPARLVSLFGFAIRFVELLREEADRLRDALRVRAFVGRLDPRTLKTYGHLAALIVLRAYDRAARIDEAMRCRGFAGHLPARQAAPWTSADGGFVAGALGAALCLGLASW